MNELLKLLITIGVNNTDAVNALNDTTKQAQTSSNKIIGFFKKAGAAIGTYLAVGKIKDFGVQIVQTAANVQAENAQFEASFKDLSNEATAMFERVGESTGVFASRLKTTGTKAFSQFKGAGIKANDALKNTETFLGLASDAAAYYDISLEDAEARIRSFLRGNVEAGDAIGLFTSESQRNQYAVDMYGKKWIKLSEAQKQNLMLKVAEDIYKQSGAIGQASRESEGLANITGNLKEVWRQFLAVIGEPVLKFVTPIITSLTSKVTELKDKVGELKQWIADNQETINQWKERILIATGVIGGLFTIITTSKALIGFADTIKKIRKATLEWQFATKGLTIAEALNTAALSTKNIIVGILTGQMTLAQGVTLLYKKAVDALNASFLANPITWVVAAIVALVAIFVVAYKKSDTFRAAVDKLWKVIKNSLIKAFEEIKPILEEVINALMELWDVIWSVIGPVIEWLLNLIKQCMPAIKAIISATIGKMVTNIKNAIIIVKTVIQNLLVIVKTVINNIKIHIQTGVNVIKNIIKVFTSVLKGDWKGAWEAIKNIGSSIMSGLKKIFSNTFSGLKTVAKNTLSNIKTVFSNTWNGIKTATSKIWNGIYKSVTNPVKKAMNKVKEYIGKIKSFFTGFSAKIKLPHFKIKNASLNPKKWIENGVPKLSVEWYKDGGIMTKPTVFDYNPSTNTARVGGEAGAEAIAPIDTLLNYVQEAVRAENSGLAYQIQRLYDIVANFLPMISENMGHNIVLDSGALVGQLTPAMDKSLGARYTRKARY